MPRSAMLAAPLLLALAACQNEGPADLPPPPQPLTEDACGASKLGRFLGAEANRVTREIASIVGERNIRVIRPGDAVTMDYRPDRLNVELSEQGTITRLRCG